MTRFSTILLSIAVVLPLSAGSLLAHSPEDDAVSSYLASHGLLDLLEVQLFDRIEREEAGSVDRQELAARLSLVYLARLDSEGLSDPDREKIMAKARVLIGMVPKDLLLDLRLALLVDQYQAHERAADLDRIGLLDEESRGVALASMRIIVPELTRIQKIADDQAETMNRSASRSVGEKLAEYERGLAEAREARSRAGFFGAWAGYSEAVLARKKVSDQVFQAFGSVLGLDGKVPVLDRVDLDLLEYEHVARAMIGVALCKMHNENLSEARVWLSAVESSKVAPQETRDLAHQRQLEVSLLEHDWVQSQRLVEELSAHEPESLVGIAQARLLVMRSLAAEGAHDLGNGGAEGIREVARLGLDRLVELGEIGHVLELRDRFGELPMMGKGFVTQYVLGLEAMGDAETPGSDAAADSGTGSSSAAGSGYDLASRYFRSALESQDAERYTQHSGDAALKLALCELKLGHPARVIAAIDEYSAYLQGDEQRDEAEWMTILALDQAVKDGQDQMGDRLSEAVGAYIKSHPSTDRANTLIVRYAMTPFLGAEDAVGSLEMENPDDPLAITARRKLIQLVYKNPSLVSDAMDTEAGNRSRVFEAIRSHAAWVWSNEPAKSENLREARERLTVCRVVLGTGVVVEGVDTAFLDGVVARGESIIASNPGLDEVRSELAFRRVQLSLMSGEIERAGEIVLTGVLDVSVESPALFMVYDRAIERFRAVQNVPNAQSVVRYGRRILDGAERLSPRTSLVAEGVASGAEYVATQTGDATIREYAGALCLRVYEEGLPSLDGLLRTAVLVEPMGHAEIAMECWLRLVARLDQSEPLWHRSRFESLRLLMELDPSKGRAVYSQYKALHPEGSPEPWGEKIEGLLTIQTPEGQP